MVQRRAEAKAETKAAEHRDVLRHHGRERRIGLRHEDDKIKRGAGVGNKMRERRAGGMILAWLSRALL